MVRSDEPVVAIEALIESRLLLLLTPWSITAIDHTGDAVWATRRLAMDGFRADEVREGWLLGVADPEPEGRESAVRLRDGTYEAGLEPTRFGRTPRTSHPISATGPGHMIRAREDAR